jgi:hypothetical protein
MMLLKLVAGECDNHCGWVDIYFLLMHRYCKVHHLENTGSALAEDVIQKSEIIKTYFMENRAGIYIPLHITLQGYITQPAWLQ